MEPANWPQAARTSDYANQSVLILDQNSNRCAADKCNALSGLLQKSLALKCIQERCVNQLPRGIAAIPDLVLVRLAASETAPELLASCKEKWSGASIVALLYATWERLLDSLPSFLTRVDDFLSCAFEQAKLLLRVRRLPLSKPSKVVSAKKPAVRKELHFGARKRRSSYV
jgi:hypothetical protein